MLRPFWTTNRSVTPKEEFPVMDRSTLFTSVATAAVALGALCAGGGVAQAQFRQTDLVSDIKGLADIT